MSDNMKLVLFSVFDENHSWYLEENIRRLCSDAAHVDTRDPQFFASNVMHSEYSARGSLQSPSRHRLIPAPGKEQGIRSSSAATGGIWS